MKRENTDADALAGTQHDGGDRIEDESPSGLSGRLRRAAGSAGKKVVGSAQAIAGADIRQFRDFADAATTVAVGVHRAQAEMNDRLASVEQSVADMRRSQAELVEGMSRLQQSVEGTRRDQTALVKKLTYVEALVKKLTYVEQVVDASASAGPSPWVIAFGAIAILALVLSLAGIVLGIL